MENVPKRFLITSGIIQLGKNSILIKDLMDYINITTHKLRKNNYSVEKINESDIYIFFKMYPGLGQCSNGFILIEKPEYASKIINKHILVNISDELRNLLRLEVKYNLPIIFNDDIVVYSFFSSDDIQYKLKEILEYDSLNNAFLISFKEASYTDISNYIIENSSKIKRSSISLNEVLEFKSKIDGLVDPKYYNIKHAFKISWFSIGIGMATVL